MGNSLFSHSEAERFPSPLSTGTKFAGRVPSCNDLRRPAALTALTASPKRRAGWKPVPTYHLINTPELFESFLAQLREQKSFSFDTETTDIRPRFAELVGIVLRVERPRSVVSAGPRAGGRAAFGFAGNARRLAADPRKSGHRKDRPESEIRYSRASRGGRGTQGHGLRFDDRRLPARRRPPRPQPRRSGLVLPRPQDDQNFRTDRQRQTSKTHGRSAACGKSPITPPKTPSSRFGCGRFSTEKLDEAELTELFSQVELPLIDVLVELEYNGIKIDSARLGRAERRIRPAVGNAGKGNSRLGGPDVQHRLAQAVAGNPVHRIEAAGARKRRRKPAPAPMPKCSKNWPRCIRCRPSWSSIGSTPN